ncbi:CPBP family intramembrane metalloprotease [Ktedonosporobacter rubrisoli]|uniref:CPBP family intramembrane metalloprotease n=1 Tax=Ktedonosporobacter rubrisoli TaxID=2509675 RepID=A0A4P6JMV8_KTERU|nr:type II CAAX endopeptidase family protein [Ktedonosporobacter rubrisoli]QBD76372.1 CPBP family intramembrane metalloprotease [Ktedonosporobacter rubrisoli]
MALQEDEHFSVSSTPTDRSKEVINGFDSVKRARRSLLLFFLILLIISLFSESLTIISQDIFSILFLMWTPALASLATRLILREGFADISFRLKGTETIKALGLAVLVPAAIGVLAYGVAWLAGLAHVGAFHPSDSLAAFIALPGSTPFPVTLLLILLYLTVVEVMTSAGEEIGWRGYMLTRLIAAGAPRPVLLSGLIWSLWHWPLILFGPSIAGLPQIVSAGVFLLTITALGTVSAYLRLATGSIWPAILLHAAWNSLLVELLDSFTQGSSLWTGESGVLVALATILVALAVSNFYWQRKKPTALVA